MIKVNNLVRLRKTFRNIILFIMRRYRGSGPFVPPVSKRDKIPLKENEADANVKEVDANMNEADVNVKVADVNVNEADANVNEADVNVNEADVNVNEADVNVNEADVNVNEADVNVNEADVNVNEADVNVNEADANVNEADANVNEADANVMEPESGAIHKAKGSNHLNGQNLEMTIDDLVGMLSLMDDTAPDVETFEMFKKDLEEGILDPDDLPFQLIRAFDETLGSLDIKQNGLDLKDIKMETDPAPDIPVVGPPPGSTSSGYSTASSKGSSSSPDVSISNIKTEKSLEDQDRESMAVSLGLIKKEPEEDHGNVQLDGHDNNDKFFLGKIKEEPAEDQAADELPEIDHKELAFEVSGAAEYDCAWVTLAKIQHDTFAIGEGKGRKNSPRPDIELCELLLAVSELEQQMQLSDDKKKLQMSFTVEIEEEEEDQDGEGVNEDEEETDGELEKDSGLENSQKSN